MTHLRTPSSRTLTVVLSETEWRALRAVEPDAVGWLQQRIRERLQSAGTADEKPGGTQSRRDRQRASWGDDVY